MLGGRTRGPRIRKKGGSAQVLMSWGAWPTASTRRPPSPPPNPSLLSADGPRARRSIPRSDLAQGRGKLQPCGEDRGASHRSLGRAPSCSAGPVSAGGSPVPRARHRPRRSCCADTGTRARSVGRVACQAQAAALNGEWVVWRMSANGATYLGSMRVLLRKDG